MTKKGASVEGIRAGIGLQIVTMTANADGEDAGVTVAYWLGGGITLLLLFVVGSRQRASPSRRFGNATIKAKDSVKDILVGFRLAPLVADFGALFGLFWNCI